MIFVSPIELLKSMVNLEGYAKSQDFIGYFESKIREYNNAHLATSWFEELMKAELPKAYLVCSFALKNIDTRSKVYNELRNTDLIDRQFGNTEQIFSDSSNEEEALNNFKSFPISDLHVGSMRTLIWLVLNGFTYGHVFFVFPEIEVVAYPHSDCGFGFLASENSEYRGAILDFLTSINADEFAFKAGFE